MKIIRLLDDRDRRRCGTRQGTQTESEHVAPDLQKDSVAGNPTQVQDDGVAEIFGLFKSDFDNNQHDHEDDVHDDEVSWRGIKISTVQRGPRNFSLIRLLETLNSSDVGKVVANLDKKDIRAVEL